MLYIDCDGVLADLQGWMRSIDPASLDSDDNFHNFVFNHYKDTFRVSRRIEEGFSLITSKDYRVLTALPNQRKFIEYGLNNGFTLSECFEIYKTLRMNKITWLQENNIEIFNIIIVESSRLKSIYAKHNSTLIDDHERNVNDFIKAGGNGILFKL